MKNPELKKILKDFPPEVNRFARYTYQVIYSSYCNGYRNGTSFSWIYSGVRGQFLNRRERRDPPFWDDYSSARITHLLVDGLTALEGLRLIELNEESGRYKVLRTQK